MESARRGCNPERLARSAVRRESSSTMRQGDSRPSLPPGGGKGSHVARPHKVGWIRRERAVASCSIILAKVAIVPAVISGRTPKGEILLACEFSSHTKRILRRLRWLPPAAHQSGPFDFWEVSRFSPCVDGFETRTVCQFRRDAREA